MGGKDQVKVAMANLTDLYYCDGKRGPGNHIWDLDFKPESADEDDTDDMDGALVAA